MRYGGRPPNPRIVRALLYQHSCGERVDSMLAAFVHLLICPASKSTTALRNRSKLDAFSGRVHRTQDALGNPVYWR